MSVMNPAITLYPCDRGIPGNFLARGSHQFREQPSGRIICTLCGQSRDGDDGSLFTPTFAPFGIAVTAVTAVLRAERGRHGNSTDPHECFVCPDEDYPCMTARNIDAALDLMVTTDGRVQE